MKHLSKEDFDDLQKFYRINLINSCTGYKSANLIGTISEDGIENVAVFSSITHLGSNPAMLGYILRPTTVPRNTYKNIKQTGVFTVNHIIKKIINDAHHTSAKYEENISEFDMTMLEQEYKEGCIAPFVKGSPVQLVCNYQNEYHIKENGTILVVASIEDLYFNKDLVDDSGFLRLDKGEVVTVNGCDGYALPSLIDRFEYQRPKK
jgi:flavin reductase (DIM6/NTAB) family NADH-FMN oxidoreductase RutF